MFEPDVPCAWMETRACINADVLAAGNAALDAGDRNEAERLQALLHADEPCPVTCARYGRPV